MNKTVNINLAGIFFHIDEDAYAKLQHYLEAIKRSLKNTQGSEEIIADIEARIAELFSEKMKTDRQVISTKEVEEVIAIMGQPEDYMVDEEIFEDEPASSRKTSSSFSTSGKQLFRDTEHSYIGGVSSGLGHYLAIDPIWLRILWIVLTIGSSGAFILIYIALWIFVPEAKTTADKLSMRGEEVNITNIERKIREGFDDVAGKVKSVDYQKYGNRAKSGASSAATGIGSAILLLLNVFVKLIGVIILLTAGTTLIALFIGLFTVGTFGIVDAPWTDYIEMAAIGAPLWLLSLLTFLVIGIPFFFLFILGLKILVQKLKTIGTPAKLVLLGLWLLSIIGLAIIGIQQATQRAFDGEVVITENLPISSGDTLYLAMQSDPIFSSGVYKEDVQIKYDDQDRKVIFTTDVRLIIKSTKDDMGRLEIVKSSEGSDFKDARERAENINYSTRFVDGKLYIGSFLTSGLKDNYRDQQVRVTLYLPEGTTLYSDTNIASFHRYGDYYGNILKYGAEENFLTITENGYTCETCDSEEDDLWESEESDQWEQDAWEEDSPDSLNLQKDSIKDHVQIKIGKNGLQVTNENSSRITIDKNGVEITKN